MGQGLQAVESALRAFWSAWAARDTEELLGLWDSDDPSCSYLPAGSDERLWGADAVQTYFNATVTRTRLVRARPRSVYPRLLNPELGSAFAELDWARRSDSSARAVGGTLRVAAVLRYRDYGTGWRLCHYAEAPLAPIIELRRFYQQIASDGHGAPE